MESIQKHEQESIELLKDPEHRDIIRAKFGKKLMQLSDETNRNQCSALIQEILLQTASNHCNDDKMILFLSNSLYNELLPYSGVYTWAEVKKALISGIREEFGQYFGLSQVTFSKFLKSYRNWEKKLEAQKEFNKLINEPTLDKPSKPLKWSEKDVDEAFQSYLNNGVVDYWKWSLYDWMKEQGTYFNWTSEEKIEMHKSAMIKLEKDTKMKLKKKLIYQVVYDLTFKNKGKVSIAANYCKIEALTCYFEKLKLNSCNSTTIK